MRRAEVVTLVAMAATLAGCTRGCARRAIEEKLAPVLPSAMPMGSACEEDLFRCVQGRLEKSRGSGAPCESPEGCPCHWEKMEECPLPNPRCVADGVELESMGDAALLCASDRIAGGHAYRSEADHALMTVSVDAGGVGEPCEDGYLCCHNASKRGVVSRSGAPVYVCDEACSSLALRLPGDLSDDIAAKVFCRTSASSQGRDASTSR